MLINLHINAGTFSSVLPSACGLDLLLDIQQSITLAMLTGQLLRASFLLALGTAVYVCKDHDCEWNWP